MHQTRHWTRLRETRRRKDNLITDQHKGQQGLIMRKRLLGKFVGILLAFLAVGSMTLLQVDQSYAAAQAQTMRVKVVLSQTQLAMLRSKTMLSTRKL